MIRSSWPATIGAQRSKLAVFGAIGMLGIAVFVLGLASKARAEQPEACGLLADPDRWALMSSGLEIKLMLLCGEITPRVALPEGEVSTAQSAPALPGVDILVNDPSLDWGGTTQSETSLVVVGDIVCAAWNDSGEGDGEDGFSGFGFSTDGGATFTDGGPFPNGPGDPNRGDPSLAYSVRDDAFYYAALSVIGLSLWKSTDACQSFSYVGPIHSGGLDDKELAAVDNNPSSPFFGRIHVGWTNFAVFVDHNWTTYSDDGGLNWSTPVALPGSGDRGQGMWPAVAPNGDVYFALLKASLSIGGLQDQWIFKSSDGGDSWIQMTDIATRQLRPENVTATESCGRQALNGDIRYLPMPQIVIHADPSAEAGYVIHAVHSYDSDGSGSDESNVFYRRSTDGALTWSAELQLNDDGTMGDQFFPAVAVNADGVVAASWYDRRLDPGVNFFFDRYAAVSEDGGLTWRKNERVSDVSSKVSNNNPHFDDLRICYHGDYDQLAVDTDTVHVIWSDDRRLTEGPNPDIYYDQVCARGGEVQPICGNGACEAFAGEDCVSCSSDCRGQQIKGDPGEGGGSRFCCGDGDGFKPKPCSDPICNEAGFVCTDAPLESCCGNLVCELGEDLATCPEDCDISCGDGTCHQVEMCSCAADCIPEPSELDCADGLDDDCDGLIDDADPDCSCVATEVGLCSDGVDNDCDGLTDGADLDCQIPVVLVPDGDVIAEWTSQGGGANYVEIDEGVPSSDDGTTQITLTGCRGDPREGELGDVTVIGEYNLSPGGVRGRRSGRIEVHVRRSGPGVFSLRELTASIVVNGVEELGETQLGGATTQWETQTFNNPTWNDRSWRKPEMTGMRLRLVGHVLPDVTGCATIGVSAAEVRVYWQPK